MTRLLLSPFAWFRRPARKKSLVAGDPAEERNAGNGAERRELGRPFPRPGRRFGKNVIVGACVVIELILGCFPLRAQSDRAGVPDWKVDPAFKADVFTFARVRYESRGWGWRRGGGRWRTDAPDADLNLSYRLQEMTSLKVNPEPTVVELTQKNLGDYPFIYIVEPGYLVFRDEEVTALRRYLDKGGFLMIDDFWGEDEWSNIESELKRVFPEREIVDLPIEHPIFHCVFDLKEKPQIPGIEFALSRRGTGITWERPDAKEVHYRAIFDPKGRMIVIICQNTDLGDGWEREGESEWYFHEFGEKKAYPMAINILFYAMTH